MKQELSIKPFDFKILKVIHENDPTCSYGIINNYHSEYNEYVRGIYNFYHCLEKLQDWQFVSRSSDGLIATERGINLINALKLNDG